jgi:enoyl-[acyl-carrier protein] reductase II
MNRITKLFNIEYPIIQAGMIWCSGWKLASAVSNSGGLGIIGSGSMYPAILEEHIIKCKAATNRPFAVNLPLLYPDIDQHVNTIIKYKVPIVFTSAGSPKTWTKKLKENGVIVVHVVSSLKFALKSQEAGVDAVVAEGFEAGGHNGKDETTTLCLIPAVVQALEIPVIAAGGIGDGVGMLSAMVLGAEGVQMGTRFVVSKESSAHLMFKNKVIESKEGDTLLTLKEITPVRLIKNHFYSKIASLYDKGGDVNELKDLLGKGRAKKGMFEGDLIEGELEIGQVSSQMNKVLPARVIVADIINEFNKAKENISSDKFNFQ